MADANIRLLGMHDIGAHRGEAAGTLMQTAEAHARTIGAVALVTTWRHDPNDHHLITSILGRRVAGRMNLPLFEYPLRAGPFRPGVCSMPRFRQVSGSMF